MSWRKGLSDSRTPWNKSFATSTCIAPGLAPEGRPVGVFLLLGPTGTGKSSTVEALADVLHGSEKLLLKVDCGEFQMDHEMAKLIVAPPGYLGHRETQPMLTQQKLKFGRQRELQSVVVAFDEMEKAASSMNRLLLDVLDKAQLRLGDNTAVNFDRTLIFLTSNLGAEAMRKAISPDFGFEAMVAGGPRTTMGKIQKHWARRPAEILPGIRASHRRRDRLPAARSDVAPIDPPSADWSIRKAHRKPAGKRAFDLEISDEAHAWILRKGTSAEYRARELKRTILRNLTQALAAMVESGKIRTGAVVRVEVTEQQDSLALIPEDLD